MESRACELCRGHASLYCPSDSAFLCSDCDANVHEANFLVARHVRRTICRSCTGFDGNIISGVGFRPVPSLCRSCEADDGDRRSAASSSSSSSCVSTAESAKTGAGRIRIGRTRSSRSGSVSEILSGGSARRTASRAEGILVIWSRRLGLRSRRCIGPALHVYGVCSREFTILPSRVSLAASLWFAASRLEPRGVSTCQLVKLQLCSRVPAKLILFVETRLSRIPLIRAKQSSRQCPDC